MSGPVGTLVIDGVEFVVIAAAEYSSSHGSPHERTALPGPAETRPHQDESPNTQGPEIRPPLTEAKQRQSRLRRARLEARLTQVQLAKRLGKSQAFVSKSEAGKAQVSERYVRAVLAACKLPMDFGAPQHREKTQDELEPHEIAGLDPETLLLVQRGSQRDRELREKYVWWANADLAW